MYGHVVPASTSDIYSTQPEQASITEDRSLHTAGRAAVKNKRTPECTSLH